MVPVVALTAKMSKLQKLSVTEPEGYVEEYYFTKQMSIVENIIT